MPMGVVGWGRMTAMFRRVLRRFGLDLVIPMAGSFQERPEACGLRLEVRIRSVSELGPYLRRRVVVWILTLIVTALAIWLIIVVSIKLMAWMQGRNV